MGIIVKPLLDGLKTTLRAFFRKPVTMQYPEERWTFPERFRGRPKLLTDGGETPRCVACGLCEKICPSRCITVFPGTGPDGVRMLVDYRLDLNRCCFCGICVEACPVEAIVMSPEYELAAYCRIDLLLGLDAMMKGTLREGSRPAARNRRTMGQGEKR